METIYIKINIKKTDKRTDEIRNEGLFFSYIAEAIGLERGQIVEIDENNFKNEIQRLNKKFNDKS